MAKNNRNKQLSPAEKELAELTAQAPTEPVGDTVVEKPEVDAVQENIAETAPETPDSGEAVDEKLLPEQPTDVVEPAPVVETPDAVEEPSTETDSPLETSEEVLEKPEEPAPVVPPEDPELTEAEVSGTPEEEVVEEETIEQPVAQPVNVLDRLFDHRIAPTEQELSDMISAALEQRSALEASVAGGFMTVLRRLYSFVRDDGDKVPDQYLVNWAKTGQLPEYIRPGIMYYDRIRYKKTVELLTDEEIGLIFLNLIEEAETVDRAAAKAEIIRRNSFHPDTSDSQIKRFLRIGEVPVVTATMTDIFKLKPARYWSDEEIRLFALGELNATSVATPEKIYDEYRRRAKISKNNYSDERVQVIISKSEKVKPTMSQTILEAELKNYAEAMGPAKAVTEAQAGAMQATLNRQLRRTIKLPAGEFEQAWTTILDWFHTNRTTHFTEARALRGMAESGIYGRDLYTFEQLLTLCVRTCDPTVRYSSNATINFGAVLDKITDETIRQKVLSYYRVGQ